MPSSLSLYNYKLSGVTDGPLSFAKAMSEVAVVGNLENTELSRISVSREALYEEHAGAGLLDVDQIQGSFDQMQGVTVTEADSKLQQEACTALVHLCTGVTENQTLAATNAAINLVCWLRQRVWFGLVWFGLVRFGCRFDGGGYSVG